MPNNLMNRRQFATAALTGLTVVAMPLPGLALTEGEAKKLVNNVVADIIKIIKSGKSEQALLQDFERIFVQYGDVHIMARSVLGVDARTATKAQMRQFTKEFQGYISRKYGSRFREFIGGEVTIKNARQIRNGYEVRTSVKLRGASPFEVTFLVSDKSGSDKFYNMFIEGVNLLLTERTEIGTMLDARKGNLNQLIKDLNNPG